MDKGVVRNIVDVCFYAAMFFLIQFVVHMIGVGVITLVNHVDFNTAFSELIAGKNGGALAVISVFCSLITIVLYAKLKWCPVSRNYLASRPWIVLIWVVFLSLGSILPSEWLYEQMQITMPEEYQELFEGIMKEPWGYVAIGMLAPIAEEMVFRGAVLRSLFKVMDGKWHWAAIVCSALIFGVVHGNVAQGVHAFVMGCLLGWLYYRTRSIVPGIVLHWVNNSVAYVLFNLMPEASDGKLIDFFHGDEKLMLGGIAFSLCILIPSIFQLALRMKKVEI
ncbi:CPBP family intramembrane glutamic endopeptidase [Segatella albensis]|uniref:CPBP family intramembrane glutamic endopeptidase n=1 Tax=Segatella albensis TaxID=77768 RepID=UPI000408FDF9|nr:CPBP family intramembrane glutamic endopeptidase [Segatella albensis]